jgi:hypothetical protein
MRRCRMVNSKDASPRTRAQVRSDTEFPRSLIDGERHEIGKEDPSLVRRFYVSSCVVVNIGGMYYRICR